MSVQSGRPKTVTLKLYALICFVPMLMLGTGYAWSVFATFIAQELTGYSATQLSMAYTMSMITFPVGGIITGYISRKRDIKKMAFISPFLFAIGFLMTSFAKGIAPIVIGYGLLGGLASGFLYNTMISTIANSFSDNVGTLSGILLTGPALGSAVLNNMFLRVASTSLTGWRTGFRGMAVIYGSILLLTAILINTCAIESTQKNTVILDDEEEVEDESKEMDTRQMIRHPSFWLYFIWALFICAAATAIISQASQLVLHTSPGISGNLLSAAVGGIAIFNALARILFGGMFDRIGIKPTLTAISIAAITSFGILSLASQTGSFMLIMAGYIFLGLGQGGMVTANAVYIRTFYGRKHYSSNFSIIYLTTVVSAFGGTLAAGIYDLSGSYLPVLLSMLCASCLALLMVALIRKP